MQLTRRSAMASKVEIPMTPMIDIVFQLLIFFMLQLKIVAPEGSFNINMPIGAPAASPSDAPNLPDLKVGLRSDANGNLVALTFGQVQLGNDEAAFDELARQIRSIIGKPGTPLSKDVEVEIDADYELHYKYIIRAVSKCTGQIDPQTKQMVRYVEKIKFAPPHKPRTAAQG